MGNVPKKSSGAALVVQTPAMQPQISSSSREPVTYRIETHHIPTKLNTTANIEILHKLQEHYHHTTNTSSHDGHHDSSTITAVSGHHKESAKNSREHSKDHKEITDSKENSELHHSVSRKDKFAAKMIGSKTGEVPFDSNNPEDLHLDESIILHNEAPLTGTRKKDSLWSKFMLPPTVPHRRPMKRVSATILPLQSKLQIHQHVHISESIQSGHRKKNSCEFLPPLHPNSSKNQLYVPQSEKNIAEIPERGARRPQTLIIPKRSSMQHLKLPQADSKESLSPKELIGQKTETLVVPDVRRTPQSSGRDQTMRQKYFQARFIQHSGELRHQNILAMGAQLDQQ